MIEVYPLTLRLKIGLKTIACKVGHPDSDATFAHVAVASLLDRSEILELGAAEGWVTRLCNRG